MKIELKHNAFTCQCKMIHHIKQVGELDCKCGKKYFVAYIKEAVYAGQSFTKVTPQPKVKG